MSAPTQERLWPSGVEMIFAADLVALCLKQTGDRYVFGHEASVSDPDPDVFDCSELVQWSCARLGVEPTMPDGSWLQARHCAKRELLRTPEDAIGIQGALLFRFKGDPFSGDRPSQAHVAISLGNGNTIEARGKKWGVGSFTAKDRGWTHAGLVPGVTYEAPPESPDPAGVEILDAAAKVPAWPGRYITQPPIMKGDDVRQWQEQVNARGFKLKIDSEYGDKSEKVCRAIQKRNQLRIDGIVGPDTWRASWVGPS